MLEVSQQIHYCKKCKAILIMWDEVAAELHKQVRYFTHDSILKIGDSGWVDDLKSKYNSVKCRKCGLKVPHYVIIERDIFLQILKYSYRDENHPDNLFKINLKSRKGQKSMVPPTLQEIKEAMVEELI